jgi:hypothetical protein
MGSVQSGDIVQWHQVGSGNSGAGDRGQITHLLILFTLRCLKFSQEHLGR